MRSPWASCSAAVEARTPTATPGDAAACTVLDDIVVLAVSDAVSGTRGERLAATLVEVALEEAARTRDPAEAVMRAARLAGGEGEATLQVAIASETRVAVAVAGDGPVGLAECGGPPRRLDPGWEAPLSYISGSRGLVGRPYTVAVEARPPYTIAVATDGIPWTLLARLLVEACTRPPLLLARRAVASRQARLWDDRGVAIATIRG